MKCIAVYPVSSDAADPNRYVLGSQRCSLQVDAPVQYGYAEAAQYSAVLPSTLQQPRQEHAQSPETQRAPEGSCSSSSTQYGNSPIDPLHSRQNAAPNSRIAETAPGSNDVLVHYLELSSAQHSSMLEDKASGSGVVSAQHPHSSVHDRGALPSFDASAQYPEPAAALQTSRLAEEAVVSPHSPAVSSAGLPRYPFRTTTIDVGALMRQTSPCHQQV